MFIIYYLICICLFDGAVEQAEPIIVAAVQQSLEFAICHLETSVPCNDDLTIQV